MIPYLKEALKNLFKKPITEKFPKAPVQTPINYRGKISYDPSGCIGCGICMKVCAGNAITKTIKAIDGGQEITLEFDLGSCTFCGMCKDFCPKKVIELTGDSQMVVTNKEDLKISGSFIKKSPPKPTAEQLKKIADAKKAAAEKKSKLNE